MHLFGHQNAWIAASNDGILFAAQPNMGFFMLDLHFLYIFLHFVKINV